MTLVDDAAVERLTPDDAAAAALVLRAAFDERLPWLSGLHTPEEDRWFFRETVFLENEVWGAARRFYEARGFSAVAFTDGARNEEGEPDVLYRWTRP